MSIESTYNTAQEVRMLFREVERQPWTPVQYAMELCVQMGHLADILLRQDYKLNKKNLEENILILGDEISDVILNAFSIAGELQLPLLKKLCSYIQADKPEFSWNSLHLASLHLIPESTTVFEMYSHLNTSCANTLQALTCSQPDNNPNFLENLANITIISSRLAGEHGIDIDSAFTRMSKESLIFVNNNNGTTTNTKPYTD